MSSEVKKVRIPVYHEKGANKGKFSGKYLDGTAEVEGDTIVLKAEGQEPKILAKAGGQGKAIDPRTEAWAVRPAIDVLFEKLYERFPDLKPVADVPVND